jgi:hypothetical protein
MKTWNEKSLQNLDYPFSTQITAEKQAKYQTLIQHQQPQLEYFSKTIDILLLLRYASKFNIYAFPNLF